ncbi:uncharacterized protein LOC135354939 [Latimeria chalumnae]|uniref:uncharacterized protein LOC135354939 n=1 Tax=Latimeria chalumnae TaxID=7897 RepID=UPI00313CA94E
MERALEQHRAESEENSKSEQKPMKNWRYGVGFHCYADDVQLYLAFPTNDSGVAAVLDQCLGYLMFKKDASNLEENEELTASENLGAKIKEQNKAVAHLTAEKDHLQETKGTLTKELKKVKAELEEKRTEIERLKALQSHSANQQALVNQLRGQLEVKEHEQENLLVEKLAAVEDMHNRLKANTESIHMLNQQLNWLSKENVNLRKLLESEKTKCQELELQLKTYSQIIPSLRAQLQTTHEHKHLLCQPVSFPKEARASNLNNFSHLHTGPDQEPFRTSQGGKSEALTREDLEQPDLRESLDKSYWIQRVGELSAQLQESTEYWTDKMNELTLEIEQAHLGSPKK